MYGDPEYFPHGLGEIVITPGAEPIVEDDPYDLLDRHLAGDWGDLCAEDKVQNRYEAKEFGTVMSSYKVNGHEVWVITDSGHKVTTILLPEEY